MEKQEIEAELNEVERDLADIARRAHIAESNLRSVADGGCPDYEAQGYRVIADDCRNTWEYANKIQNWLRQTREKYRRVAAREGGAE